MKKVFTDAKRQELIGLVEQIEREQFSPITDGIGDFFGGIAMGIVDVLGLRQKLYYTRDYEKLMLDTCNITKDRINAVFESVSGVDSRYASLVPTHEANAYRPAKRYLDALVETINPSAGSFTNAAINARFAGLDLPRVNPAFKGANADNGIYGGDQGAYQLNPDAYKDIVRKYFPDYSDKQVKELLERLNSEGCGYVSLCNTLFKEYVGREDEFERTFGFPLYKDGHYNYGALIVDLYCSKDNPNASGTSAVSRKEIWESYLSGYGVSANVNQTVYVTPENYGAYVKGGDITVGAAPVILYDESGKRVFYAPDSGHAMTVTGVTDDNKFIVSSWGKKYYLNPSDYNGGNMVVGYSEAGWPIVERDGKRVVVYDEDFEESGHLVFSQVRY